MFLDLKLKVNYSMNYRIRSLKNKIINLKRLSLLYSYNFVVKLTIICFIMENPEKSSKYGIKMYQNFIEFCKK